MLKSRLAGLFIAIIAVIGLSAAPANAELPGTCDSNLVSDSSYYEFCINLDQTLTVDFINDDVDVFVTIDWTSPSGLTATTGPFSERRHTHTYPFPAENGVYTLSFQFEEVDPASSFPVEQLTMNYLVEGITFDEPKGTIESCPKGKPVWIDGLPQKGSGSVFTDGLIQRWECVKA